MLEAGVKLDGASDHGVSEAIYLRDPDDNGIELYCDHPRSEWPYSGAGKLAMLTRPLDLEAFLTSTLSHLKALILFAINLKLHTTAFAFLKALLLFLLVFYHNSGFIRFGLNSAQIQLFYAALSCAPAWRLQRYKSLVARA